MGFQRVLAMFLVVGSIWAVSPTVAAATPPPVLNVLVLYTDAERAGRPDAEWAQYLDGLFAEANEAYADSGARIFLRAVDSRRIDAGETLSNFALLEQLTPARPSYDSAAFGEVETWRAAANAHLVTLLRPWDAAHAGCGAAQLQACGHDGACADANLGYSVVSTGSCPVGTLATQSAHNLGRAAGDLAGPIMDVARDQVADWIAARGIIGVATPPEVLRGAAFPIRFEPFGVLGARFDIDLYRHGARVASLAAGEWLPTGAKMTTLPPDLAPGGGYTVRVAASHLPGISAESAPITVKTHEAPSTLAFSVGAIEAPGASIIVSVTRGGDTDHEVSVDYVTVGGTAYAGVNFTAVSGTLTWGAGETTTRNITINDLRSIEGGTPSNFRVVLQNPTTDAVLGTPSQIVVTIPGRAGGGGGALDAWILAFLLLVAVMRAGRSPRTRRR